MSKVVTKYLITIPLILTSFSVSALPIDWHGTFGVETSLIDNFRFIKKTTQKTSVNAGTQEVNLATGSKTNSAFQTYVFKLQPEMIINDSATLKAEFSSGYGRGGFLGEDPTSSKRGNFGNALYAQNQSSGTKAVVLNKVYAELYSDTATYLIGRHSSHWGLGALVNNGEGSWDRHSSTRDGITANLKIGNFHISPYWAKTAKGSSLTASTSINESGISLLYDNKEKDMSFGLLYGTKESAAYATGVVNGDGTTELGSANVKITDLYFKKKMGDFDIGIEVPIMSGEIGNVFGSATAAKYKARAVIIESNYKLTDTMSIGLDAGQVSGDDGKTVNFSAMYLNPNYQVANLMFRYNTQAISDSTKNIYDSYINNATYFRLKFDIKTDRVDWNFAFLKALASETAAASGLAFNHSTNTGFTSTVAQSDDMGMEIDFGFNYHWNKEITIGGAAGYMLTGDYWSYTNDTANVIEADNAFSLQLNTSIQF